VWTERVNVCLAPNIGDGVIPLSHLRITRQPGAEPELIVSHLTLEAGSRRFSRIGPGAGEYSGGGFEAARQLPLVGPWDARA
jgi:hypothetical protein